MGSLDARGVAEGDRTGFWQAVLVDLFSGGSPWWHSSCGASSLQAGIVACGTRGDFQRRYGTSIGTSIARWLGRSPSTVASSKLHSPVSNLARKPQAIRFLRLWV